MGSGPNPLLYDLFSFDATRQNLANLLSTFGTATSGPLGALVLAFFVTSLVWVWVKTKFDTWAFWDVFLRLFITVTGIALWDTLFWNTDAALGSLVGLFGAANPNQEIANLLLIPYSNVINSPLPILTLAMGQFFVLFELLLVVIALALYNLNLFGAALTVLLLYVVGPLFLACYVFDPLHDMWMKYVRFYLTIKVWMLLQNVVLYIMDNAAANNIQTLIGSMLGGPQSLVYLLLLIFMLGATLPIASRLVGVAAVPLFSGGQGVGMAGAAAGAALVVGSSVAGAVGGPGGSAVGGVVGGAAKTAAGAVTKAATREGN